MNVFLTELVADNPDIKPMEAVVRLKEKITDIPPAATDSKIRSKVSALKSLMRHRRERL